jgi:hypothetical protein
LVQVTNGSQPVGSLYPVSRVDTFLISSSSETLLVLPHLEVVSGSFTITLNRVTTADFPVLTSVGGGLYVGFNSQLISLRLVALVTVGGTISIVSNGYGLVVLFSPVRTFEVYCEGGSDLTGLISKDAHDCVMTDSCCPPLLQLLQPLF